MPALQDPLKKASLFKGLGIKIQNTFHPTSPFPPLHIYISMMQESMIHESLIHVFLMHVSMMHVSMMHVSMMNVSVVHLFMMYMIIDPDV